MINNYEKIKTNYNNDKEMMTKTNANIIFDKTNEQNKYRLN